MRYTERKDFLYDTEVFKRQDTQIALKIQREYVDKHSPTPRPQFFEVDRQLTHIDPVWHAPVAGRTLYTSRSPMSIAAINFFEKPDWRATLAGLKPSRIDKFWMSNLSLQELDYFPTRGDMVFWQGYRYAITRCAPDPEAYWHQTGVWLGIVAECQIVPEGDARPLTNLSVASPAEIAPTPTNRPRPEA